LFFPEREQKIPGKPTIQHEIKNKRTTKAKCETSKNPTHPKNANSHHILNNPN